MLDNLCQRYSVLPSAIRKEDAYLFRMLELRALAGDLDDVRPGLPEAEEDPVTSPETLALPMEVGP